MQSKDDYMISTHALREEGDVTRMSQAELVQLISTHALREEGDAAALLTSGPDREFLPTPSARRATVHCYAFESRPKQFLPTPSARRATGR